MLTSIKQRFGHDDEQGFTLIELMVVVLIIAILLAIAIPTFLGAKSSANARAAQSNLRNALTAEQTGYTNSQTFIDSTVVGPPTGVSLLKAVEPNLNWVLANVTASGQVQATVPTAGVLQLNALGADNKCYEIAQVQAPVGTNTAAGTFFVWYTPAAGPTCASLAAPLSTGTSSATVAGPGAASAGASGLWASSF